MIMRHVFVGLLYEVVLCWSHMIYAMVRRGVDYSFT